MNRLVAAYPEPPSSSPWIAQMAPDGPPRPLTTDATTDVAIVGVIAQSNGAVR